MKEIWQFPPEIKSERLLLNWFRHDDLSELYHIAQKLNSKVDENGHQPFYAFYVDAKLPSREEEVYRKVREYLDGLINIHRGDVDIYGYAVRRGGKLTGYVGLCFQEENNKIIKDIGYFLDPDYQGKGYATEANAAMCQAFFKDFEEIVGTTNPKNLPSCRILEKLGFLQTGFIEKSNYDDAPRIKWTLTKDDFVKNFKNLV